MRDWDYIIIGGGSAGCVLANRLSAREHVQVLLLDAGRNDRHWATRIPAGQMAAFPRPDMNWLYRSEPDPSRDRRVDVWPAGKVIGGGSAINGMMYVRGHRWDYDHWESLGNRGWGYEGVLPYFRSLENSDFADPETRGRHGPQRVSRIAISNPLNRVFMAAAQEVGIPFNPDLNGASQEGVGECQATQKKGRRHSTARAFLEPVRHRGNLTLELGARVDRIEVEQGRGRGVEYLRNGRVHQASTRHGVILCGGAIASPKIMLQSGLGPARELAELGIPLRLDLPGVGKNLREHPVVRMSFHVRNAPTLTGSLRNPLRALMHGLDYVFRGRGALTTCIGHVQALVRTRPGLAAPNAQIIFAPLSYDLTERGPRPCTRPAVGVGVGLCRIRSSGEIRLRDARPESAPVIDYALLDNPDDIAQLTEACRLTREIFAAKAFAPYLVDERIPGVEVATDAQWEKHIREHSGLMFHPSGTCKMGRGPLAVVDDRLRVRGVDGLWIADASVMPTIPAGNINASCIMIGEKAADLIRHTQD